MKIVLVTRVWPMHRPGGMPHVCYDRSVELAKTYEVHVLTTSRSPIDNVVKPSAEVVENNVCVHYLSVPAHRWTREFAEECSRTVSTLSPSILHLDSFDREYTWWEGKKTAITLHGFGMGAWFTRWNLYRAGAVPSPPVFDHMDITREIQGLRKAYRVLGVSRWEVRMLLDQYGLSPDRVRLVYNPIAPYFFGGQLTGERKGFISVAASQQGIRGFPTIPHLMKTHLPEESYRVLTGFRREDLSSYYRTARALVLPTAFAQGYDLAIAEGRACGCPAIMTTTGSYLDEKGEWDVGVRLGSSEDMVSALVRMTSRSFNDIKTASFDASVAAEVHRPENHVKSWLAAIAG